MAQRWHSWCRTCMAYRIIHVAAAVLQPFPKEIIYTAGNRTLSRSPNGPHARGRPAPGVHFLDRGTVQLGYVRSMGTLLWTDFELYSPNNREVAVHQSDKRMDDLRLIGPTPDLIATRATASPRRPSSPKMLCSVPLS